MKPLYNFLIFNLIALSMQAQEMLTPEKMWQLGRINLEDVSPNGKMALFTVKYFEVSKNKGASDIYLLDVASETVKQLTFTPEVSESNVQFRPESKKIGFLREKALYEMNYEGNQLTKITPDNLKWEGFKYSPIGTHILAVQSVKYGKSTAETYKKYEKAEVRIYDDLMYRHWTEWEDNYRNNLFLYTYLDGKISEKEGKNILNEAYDCPMKPMHGIEDFAWTPKGKGILYACKKERGTVAAFSTNSNVYLYDLSTNNTYNASEDNPGYDTEPSPQYGTAGYVIWHSMAKPGNEADRNRIFRFSLSQWGNKEEITAGFDEDAGSAKSDKNGNIFFIAGDKGTKQIFKWDIQTQKIVQLTNGQFDYTSYLIADNCLIATRNSMSAPPAIYKVNLDNGQASQVYDCNKNLLATLKMGEVKRRWVKTTDNKEMNVWVIYPPDFDPGKKYPALLYCQGGPQSALSQTWSYRWNMQLMAAQGYVVVAPCRRGMPSFGREWNEQISGDWGGQCMQDYLSAIDDVMQERYIDKERIGAVGASFGGYSVFWLAGNHQKRFKCFIAHCGMFNTESWYGTTEELFFAKHELGEAYWETPTGKSWNEFSPHRFVQNWDTPIMIMHGEQDFRVPVSEGLQAFQAARIKGIPARLVLFPNEGHWILSPQNSMVWNAEFFGWLNKHLK